MQYTVRPKEYHRGYCPTICDTMESAEEELALMRKYTTFEWEIVEELDDEDEEELQRVDDEAHVKLYQRYFDDEDDGTLYDDDEDDYEEDEGKPQYVLDTPGCAQVYDDYAKAVEGFNFHCAYYEREGWTTMCKKVAKNEVTIDGVKVRAMRAVYDKGVQRREVELKVRIDCD